MAKLCIIDKKRDRIMADYGQFCPVAKASELLGERWTLLILRELVLGTHRFSEFQRGLSRISPTLLSKRLGQLERAGIVIRKPQKGMKGFEYYLTPSGRELAPLIEQLAGWGMRWARGQLSDGELDVEFLMWDIQRRLQLDALPDGETVICFIFNELEKFKSWWLVVEDDKVDLCTENPGKEVDVYINASVRSMVEIWQGNLDIRKALRDQVITVIGNKAVRLSLPDWLGICLYAHIKPAV
jgi:DNA-binding HxlR family transcriptional regulator